MILVSISIKSSLDFLRKLGRKQRGSEDWENEEEMSYSNEKTDRPAVLPTVCVDDNGCGEGGLRDHRSVVSSRFKVMR